MKKEKCYRCGEKAELRFVVLEDKGDLPKGGWLNKSMLCEDCINKIISYMNMKKIIFKH